MSELESAFIRATLGIKWVKNGDDIERDGGLDCWGAVRLSFAILDGIELPQPPQRSTCDVAASIKSTQKDYEPSELSSGAIFICSNQYGFDDHVGRVIGGYAWHCQGSIQRPECVQVHRMSAIIRQQKMIGGSVRFVQPKCKSVKPVSDDARQKIASSLGIEIKGYEKWR